MPPSAVQRIASALLAPLGVLPMFEAVRCVVCVWVNESRPGVWPLRQLVVRAEVVA
jgi:hypothetical protein